MRHPAATDTSLSESKVFYDRQYTSDQYASVESHGQIGPFIRAFISAHGLDDKKVLEIGCGRGVYQDYVSDYTGVDLADSAAQFLHKPFHQASATALPFADNSFDAAWSIYVLEHIPDPELALREIRRVIKPGGFLFLAPAWQCRSWAAGGYAVRPYSDFGLGGKLIKASIPIRNSIVFRSAFLFPGRVYRLLKSMATGKPTTFHHSTLTPNYDICWTSDSDAINVMDPHDAILWFRTRQDKILHPATPLAAFLFRTGHLVIQIQK